jgi:D-xylose reductase
MVAGRFCRTSINTVRSFTSVAVPRSSFLPPVRTCISRTIAPTFRPTFTNRNFFATMAVNTPYVTLNDGNKMPQVGFGLWKVDNDTCADTVYNAIKTGYRLFDGACGMYTSLSARTSPSTHSIAFDTTQPKILKSLWRSAYHILNDQAVFN